MCRNSNARTPAAHREGDRTLQPDLCLRRMSALHRRRRLGAARHRACPVPRYRHPSPQICMPVLHRRCDAGSAPARLIPGGMQTEATVAHVLASQVCRSSAASLIGRVWSIVYRAGPCFCPWSAFRHKMRTMVRRAAPSFISCFSATWADTSSSRPPSLLGTHPP